MESQKSISAKHSALVVIDMQNAYFRSGELHQARELLVKSCNELIAMFREANRPVIHVRTAHVKSGETWTLNMRDDKEGYLFDGTDDVEFLSGIDIHKDDAVITKQRDSAFHASLLEQYLHEHQITTLAIAGVSTHTCIGQTAADAYARNIRVLLANDAIRTHDSAYHELALSMLAKEYRQKRLSSQSIREWIGTPMDSRGSKSK